MSSIPQRCALADSDHVLALDNAERMDPSVADVRKKQTCDGTPPLPPSWVKASSTHHQEEGLGHDNLSLGQGPRVVAEMRALTFSSLRGSRRRDILWNPDRPGLSGTLPT